MNNDYVWANFENDLRLCIRQAWPEVFGPEHPIYRVTQAERRPWRSLIQTEQMLVPWVVWMADQTQQSQDYGACNVIFNPKITVYYVTSTSEGTSDIAGFVQSKLHTFDEVLRKQDYFGFQYLEESIFDISAENAANAQFLKNNIADLFGGSLSFRIQFGYVWGEENS